MKLLRMVYRRVEKDTTLNEIFSIVHDSPVPVVVLENNKLKGVIVRGAVIGALAGEGGVNM